MDFGKKLLSTIKKLFKNKNNLALKDFDEKPF